MKSTFNLLEQYLIENHSEAEDEAELSDYSINGSIISLTYTYNPRYAWDKTLVKEDKVQVELLDYITWVYNQCNKEQK